MTTQPLTERITAAGGGVVDLAAYERAGGYTAARQALTTMTPKEVQDLVKKANLRGRGGAGFPTGQKWSFVPLGEAAGTGHKYLICNADEMEPGTFKDRYLMEFDPHSLVEGMLIAAYAIGADKAFIFLRGEYHGCERALKRAIADASAQGYLGANAFGTDFSVELATHMSGGRYICGEETALLSALESRRAQPRSKPPFPPASGAWGRPSVVNNVETLCNVAPIVRHGADWFVGLGRGADAGTKLFGVSGRVKRPGLWELPMGTPIREILDLAGGMQDGYQFKALLPGGASTDFLVAQHLDLAMDYGTIAAAGSRMGTGTMTVVDDSICIVDLSRNLQHFFAQESCGFCTPCREGLPWLEQLLTDIEEGRGEPGDLDVIAQNAQLIGAPGNTFCAHATGAIEPLQSAIKYFRDEFEAHIKNRGCPHRSSTAAAARGR